MKNNDGNKLQQPPLTENIPGVLGHGRILHISEILISSLITIFPFLASLCAYGVKNNRCLFERLFKIKKNGVFLSGISYSV